MQQDVLYLSFSYIINFEFSLIPKQSYWWLAIQLCRSSICVHSLFHLPKHPQATTCLDEWLSIKPLMLSLKYCFCCIIKLRIKNWSWKMHSWMKLASIHNILIPRPNSLCSVLCNVQHIWSGQNPMQAWCDVCVSLVHGLISSFRVKEPGYEAMFVCSKPNIKW